MKDLYVLFENGDPILGRPLATAKTLKETKVTDRGVWHKWDGKNQKWVPARKKKKDVV